MSRHAHDYVSAFDCDASEQGAVKPKHRAHRHTYIVGYDHMSMSRAKCSTGKSIVSCDGTYCPKHQPVNYANHMAGHTTDGFW